jgi:hypothetical protein
MNRSLAAIGLVVALLVVVAAAVVGTDEADPPIYIGDTTCKLQSEVIISAQSVPTSPVVPCVETPRGWSIERQSYSSEGMELELRTGSFEGATWRIVFTESCAAVEPRGPAEAGAPAGIERSQSRESGSGSDTITDWFVAPGGCIESAVTIPHRYDEPRLVTEIDDALIIVRRDDIDRAVRQLTDGQVGLAS